MESRLIFFEGIPGSGKTTIAGRLHAFLVQQGIAADFYPEGCEHPVDLPYHAYLSHDAFRDVLHRYSRYAGWLKDKAIVEDDYVLVPYRRPTAEPMDEELFRFLESREVCYSNKPAVPFELFREVFRKRFERFAVKAVNAPAVTIFDGVLFQHQIHDVHRLYPDVCEDELINHLYGLSQTVLGMRPILFYFSQDSVRNSLVRTAAVRSKPKWATEESVSYYEKRQRTEMKAVHRLPIVSHVIPNPDFDWDSVFKTVVDKIHIQPLS